MKIDIFGGAFEKAYAEGFAEGRAEARAEVRAGMFRDAVKFLRQKEISEDIIARFKAFYPDLEE